MFGYIRPFLPELKVKELEQFRACYCGLCHALKKEYGQASRFILNYDFTFMAMLLWRSDLPFCFEPKACVVSPFKKKSVCPCTDSLSLCAGLSVILAFWKECDSVADEPFFKSLKARFARIFLSKAYKKAAEKYPQFNECAKKNLAELSELEKNNEPSLDKAADKFAMLLSSIADESEDETQKRVLSQLLYHTGRFIYIADAYSDLDDDIKEGKYNPIALRFSLKNSSELTDEMKETIKISLFSSQRFIASAFELLSKNCWNDIVRNIVYDGIPDIGEKVLNGTFENVRESKRKI